MIVGILALIKMFTEREILVTGASDSEPGESSQLSDNGVRRDSSNRIIPVYHSMATTEIRQQSNESRSGEEVTVNRPVPTTPQNVIEESKLLAFYYYDNNYYYFYYYWLHCHLTSS